MFGRGLGGRGLGRGGFGGLEQEEGSENTSTEVNYPQIQAFLYVIVSQDELERYKDEVAELVGKNK